MDDSPIESRRGGSKKNWIWVILGLVILTLVVIWAVRRGLDTEAGTEPSTMGALMPSSALERPAIGRTG